MIQRVEAGYNICFQTVDSKFQGLPFSCFFFKSFKNDALPLDRLFLFQSFYLVPFFVVLIKNGFKKRFQGTGWNELMGGGTEWGRGWVKGGNTAIIGQPNQTYRI